MSTVIEHCILVGIESFHIAVNQTCQGTLKVFYWRCRASRTRIARDEGKHGECSTNVVTIAKAIRTLCPASVTHEFVVHFSTLGQSKNARLWYHLHR